MDKRVYKKTRYQNIYRNIRTNTYIIRIKKPRDTTINKDKDGNKIYDIETAKKIRDRISIKQENISKVTAKDTFKTLWKKYIYYCENIKKLAYNTIKKKNNFYKAHFIIFDNQKITEITKEQIVEFLKKLNLSDKQKNEILTCLKGFFNWCAAEEYLLKSPTNGIQKIRVQKVEMKYWTPEELKKFIDCLDSINNAYSKRIKILTLLAFTMGDRIGETRALTWNNIDFIHNTISISHSINYNPQSKDFLSSTKNYQSERIVDVSDKILDELKDYKRYLLLQEKELNDIIFYNYRNKKPYSDTALRKQFDKFINIADVPRIRLYDLRHTFVTTMMSEGWQLYHISKRIGHKNYATTVDKYGHIESNTRKEIAKTTDKYY